MLPLLAVVLAACGGLGPAPAGDATTPAVAPTGTADAGPTAEVNPTAASLLATATALAGGPTLTPDPTIEALAAGFQLPRKGPDEPIIMIFEFADYLCPYCRQFAEETVPEIEREFIADGRVGLSYWDFPLPNHGFAAQVGAEAAHCAGEQDRYWDMHDALYGHFRELADLELEDEPAAMAATIQIGEGIGLEPAAYRACVESRRYRPIVTSLVERAKQQGVELTPTIVISSKTHAEPVLGFLPYEDFKPILEREISRALGTPVPTDTPAPATPTP
jgi:protein-disulfide isomerase